MYTRYAFDLKSPTRGLVENVCSVSVFDTGNVFISGDAVPLQIVQLCLCSDHAREGKVTFQFGESTYVGKSTVTRYEDVRRG